MSLNRYYTDLWQICRFQPNLNPFEPLISVLILACKPHHLCIVKFAKMVWKVTLWAHIFICFTLFRCINCCVDGVLYFVQHLFRQYLAIFCEWVFYLLINNKGLVLSENRVYLLVKLNKQKCLCVHTRIRIVYLEETCTRFE